MNITTTLELTTTEHEDPAFVHLVARILNATVDHYRPEDIYVVRIDNWFDHKWLYFSGCRYRRCGTWLGPLRRIPAFHPHRVQSQQHYHRGGAAEGRYEPGAAAPLHTIERRNPQDRPRLQRISPAGLYLWYSAGTRETDRASLMVYAGHGEDHVGWYASFYRRGEWKLGMSKGIPVEEVRRFAALQ